MAQSHRDRDRDRERGSGPLPNRWLYCPRKSDSIIAERFLAFKTPLSQSFQDKMPIECTFRPEMLFDYCKTLKVCIWNVICDDMCSCQPASLPIPSS